jgi:hypothetical protein
VNNAYFVASDWLGDSRYLAEGPATSSVASRVPPQLISVLMIRDELATQFVGARSLGSCHPPREIGFLTCRNSLEDVTRYCTPAFQSSFQLSFWNRHRCRPKILGTATLHPAFFFVQLSGICAT